ncbi:MAG: cytidylate kinase family protein [Patescibacteria group bacterium]|nr:cytidylate kinase family protein [Patescibacteria group bacterium]MDE1966330.1 cytidylate kinase family protein [Patescibacteria group bacterium]
MKKHVITITGALGSGKSSTANGVAKELGYERFSAGDFQRAAAASLNLPYDQYQKLAEQDPQYDHRADDALIEAGKSEKRVIDARLGYHFIPDSFKVFLTLPPQIAAMRILKDAQSNPNRHKETMHGAKDVPTIAKSIEARRESERHRYEKYYGIKDPFERSNFDLVIDTSETVLPEVVEKVIAAYREWLEE